MKLHKLNGWDLIESLNNEVRQFDDHTCEIQDHNRRRAAMQFLRHNLLAESREPQTGIYFWAPVGNSWQLETFFDSQFPTTAGAELDHATIWSKWANTILRKDDSDAPPEIANSYGGLPRGRVTKTIIKNRDGSKQRAYLILHGNDSPIKNAGKLIAARFNLPSDRWKFEFEKHERMNRDDVAIIQRYINRDLGLLRKAIK